VHAVRRTARCALEITCCCRGGGRRAFRLAGGGCSRGRLAGNDGRLTGRGARVRTVCSAAHCRPANEG
jgi:hypothetical protein